MFGHFYSGRRFDETDGSIKIGVARVRLMENKPYKIFFKAEKMPASQLVEGIRILQGIIVDNDSPITALIKAVRPLDLSPRGKIYHIINIVRDNLSYSQDESSIFDTSLSEIITRKRGVCRHFTALFAVLAQASGLDTIIVGCGNNKLVNIIRPDTGQPLFKSVPLGKVNAAHCWNEVKIGNVWIPVDPTANLVGFKSEQRSIFHGAQYCHPQIGEEYISVELLDDFKKYLYTDVFMEFKAGEAMADVSVMIYSRKIPSSFELKISLKEKNNPEGKVKILYDSIICA